MKAVIALGANIGDSRRQINQSVEAIKKFAGVGSVIAVSSLYETEPVDAPGQPNFINAVLILETKERPLDLLKKLQKVENDLGRVRTGVNSPRTIDLDLITLGELFLDSQSLTLPHPRAHLRKFVLEPWAEIDPSGELPGYGSITKLLLEL